MSYPQVTDVGHVKNEAWLKVKGWLCQWVAKGKSKNELFELWQSRKCVEWLFILETVIWASVASLRRLLHRKTAEHVQTPLRTVEAQAWAIKSDQPGLSIKTVAQSLEPQQSHLSLMQKHINKVRQSDIPQLEQNVIREDVLLPTPHWTENWMQTACNNSAVF
uniref:uncharacterized protein LOC118522647 isoform X2 n=1 Tax=Halichoerus grypus TaxID=9711 RepID=UPI001658CBD8|nr:uncharacterized protein LOC118522647 isoform X2 [Halichoerus grypus]